MADSVEVTWTEADIEQQYARATRTINTHVSAIHKAFSDPELPPEGRVVLLNTILGQLAGLLFADSLARPLVEGGSPEGMDHVDDSIKYFVLPFLSVALTSVPLTCGQYIHLAQEFAQSVIQLHNERHHGAEEELSPLALLGISVPGGDWPVPPATTPPPDERH